MTYTELSGSPKESLSESSGSSAERKFLVPWNARLTFSQLLVSTATGYPHFPQARVVSIDIHPLLDGEAVPQGTIVSPEIDSNDYGTQPTLITVKYGPDFTQKVWPTGFTKPSIRSGTELRFQIRGSAKFLTIPASACKWEDDDEVPVPEDVHSAMLIPMRAIQLQWDFVDDPPIARLEDLQGKLNADSFLGSEPETLLFESYDVTESFRSAPANPHTNRVTIQLLRRRVKDTDVYGWNHDYREEPAGWAKLLLSDDNPRYQTTNFGGMFA
jgi:hypothetical protein